MCRMKHFYTKYELAASATFWVMAMTAPRRCTGALTLQFGNGSPLTPLFWASSIKIKSTSLLYWKINMHSKLYTSYTWVVFLPSIVFVGSCHSSPENVFRSLASRIKSRAQANKLDRCLDSYLATILCSSTALSWNRQWLGAGTGKQTDWRIDPSAGFFKKFGWLNHIFGWYPA